MKSNGDINSGNYLKKHYLYKLSTNLIGFVINLATAGIVPRGLGAATYGDFIFLSTFFSRVISFFDSGTSAAFYIKLSQRPKEQVLIRFYWSLIAIMSLVTLILTSLVFVTDLGSELWPGQTAYYVWMALILALWGWYSQIINKILDAYNLTVGSEIVRIQQKVVGASILILMFWFDRFSLAEFFIYNYIILLFVCTAWVRVLKRNGFSIIPKISLTKLEIQAYTREFYDYSAPLVTLAFTGLLISLLDNWFLQNFAGSVQQGFYGLSFKISSICFVFTSAMTPLLMREFSKAFAQQNLNKMRVLFQRYIPMLYVIAAFFGVFLAIQADKVGRLLGGPEFSEATLAISIMAFYPIHQTYGQLSGSVFYATDQTRLIRNLRMSTQLLGLFITWWLIGPEKWLGLNLGATGLAIKTVALQVVSVNLQLWFNARLLRFSFWQFVGHQLYSVGLLTALAWLTVTGVDQFIGNTLLAFLVSGFLYTLAVIGLVLTLPSLLFMSRTELMRQLAQLRLTIEGYLR